MEYELVGESDEEGRHVRKKNEPAARSRERPRKGTVAIIKKKKIVMGAFYYSTARRARPTTPTRAGVRADGLGCIFHSTTRHDLFLVSSTN